LKVQEAKIVGNLLFPADEQAPGAIQPRVRAFDFPAAGWSAATFGLGCFIHFPRHVRSVAALPRFLIALCATVAFIEAEMLRLLWCALGTRDRDSV
jgi:hypothetical protein